MPHHCERIRRGGPARLSTVAAMPTAPHRATTTTRSRPQIVMRIREVFDACSASRLLPHRRQQRRALLAGLEMSIDSRCVSVEQRPVEVRHQQSRVWALVTHVTLSVMESYLQETLMNARFNLFGVRASLSGYAGCLHHTGSRCLAHCCRFARAVSVCRGPRPDACPQGPGQVAVVISVEGLRIPDVQVELRDLTANVVVARTRADAIGQVTFPDVRGRALRGQSHPGRICRRRVGTFRRPARHDRTGPDRDAPHLRSRERRGDPAGQLADREPAAGRGQRSAHRREDGHSAAGRRRLSVAADAVAVASCAVPTDGCA